MKSTNSLTQLDKKDFAQKFMERFRFLELRKSMLRREDMPLASSVAAYGRVMMFRANRADSMILEHEQPKDDDEALMNAFTKKLRLLRHC